MPSRGDGLSRLTGALVRFQCGRQHRTRYPGRQTEVAEYIVPDLLLRLAEMSGRRRRIKLRTRSGRRRFERDERKRCRSFYVRVVPSAAFTTGAVFPEK